MGVDQKILEILIRAKDETKAGLDSAAKSAGGLGKGLENGGAAALGAAAAITGIGIAAVTTASQYDMSVVTMQRATGLSATAASQATAVFDRYNVTGKASTTMLKMIATQAVATGTSAHPLNTAFGVMGISVKDANGHYKDQVTLLKETADWYSKQKDKTLANAEAAKVLGKNYAAMLPALAGGGKTIAGAIKVAGDAGLILTQQQLNDAKKLASETADMGAKWKGFVVQIGNILVPLATKVIGFFSGFMTWLDKLSPSTKNMIVTVAEWAAGILAFGGGFALVAGAVISAAGTIATVFGGIAAAVGWVVTSMVPMIVSLATTAAGWVAEGIAAAAAWIATAGPIIFVIAAIALVAMGVYEIIKHWGAITKFFAGLWKAVVAGVVGFAKDVGKFFSGLWTTITKFFAQWGPAILAVIAPFIGIPLLIAQHWNVIGPFIKGVFNGAVAFCKNGIDSIIGFIAGLPQRAVDALKNLGSMIGNALKGALNALSYLNPFAKHSPSLVDNVVAGAAQIAKHYAGLSGMKIGAPVIGGLGSNLAFAGAGGGAGGGGSVNERLVRVLESLDRNGVVATVDARAGSRGLGTHTIHTARSGAM